MSSGILTGKLRFSPPILYGQKSVYRHHPRDSKVHQNVLSKATPYHPSSKIFRGSGVGSKSFKAEKYTALGSLGKPFYDGQALYGGKYSGRLSLHASLSSYANSGEEEYNGDSQAGFFVPHKDDEFHTKAQMTEVGSGNGGMKGMADAFGISSQTAYGITMVISVAALVLPLFMRSLGMGLAFKTKILSYITLLFGFYMAWNIGANDVANAMGTSVGSGALTLPQAVIAAAILEFAGAFLIGSHVSHTMQKGILVADAFKGKSSLLFCGMLSSLAAAGTWLQVASYYGWPVSTTHCIIGAMVGFGLVFGGFEAVFWKSLARVVSSWVISPFIGAAVAFVVYKCIRVFVYSAANPGRAAATTAPILVFLGFTSLVYAAFPLSSNLLLAAVEALGCGIVGALSVSFIIHKKLGRLLEDSTSQASPRLTESRPMLRFNLMTKVDGPTGANLTIVYTVFGYLQVLSACFMSFAHGANDVANAIGPISTALAILQGISLSGDIGMPVDVLAWGGFGIVAGLLVWGYRVIATIGKKITELTPTRGFAAEFAAATVVVLASRLGLPISATHTLVGAVMGVGFARGFNSVHGDTVRGIVASWIVTIPVGAVLSVAFTAVLRALIPSIT